jgi:hypothetical protein
MTAHVELELHLVRRAFEGRVHLTVALFKHRRFGRSIRREVAWGLPGIRDNRPILIFNQYKVGGILGHGWIGREHRHNRLTNVPHAPSRKRWLTVGLQPLEPGPSEWNRPQIGQILARPDRNDALQSTRSVTVNRTDPGMSDRRSDNTHVKHVRHKEIGNKLRFAPDQRRILQPR